ncbi:YadA C-terminal domain-containing protein, partial [Herbiconiux daphne]
AVDSYLSSFKNVPAYVGNTLKGSANTLNDVNNMLKGNSYYDGSKVVSLQGTVKAAAPVAQAAPVKHVELIVNVEQYPSTEGAKEIVTGAPESHKATLVETKNTAAQTITKAASEATQTAESSVTVIETREDKSSIVKGATEVVNPQAIERSKTTVGKEESKPAISVVKMSETIKGADGKDGAEGKQGVSGKKGATGSNGKDGVTTVITKTVVDNETRATVLSHSRAINRNSAAIERNSKAIERNTKQIAANTKAIKQVGAMAQATSNLHYNASNSGYAMAVGEYKGAVAFAGGVQKQINEHTAVTVQVSYDGDSVGASVGIHGDF